MMIDEFVAANLDGEGHPKRFIIPVVVVCLFSRHVVVSMSTLTARSLAHSLGEMMIIIF